MSEQKHTQEPWQIEQSEDSDYLRIGRIDERGIMPFVICSLHDEANARRIVACVNACAGAEESTLSVINAMGGLGEFWKDVGEANTQLMGIKQQRDELLNMLKRTQDSLSHISLHSECPWACGRIDEAFEEIEGLINKVESK